MKYEITFLNVCKCYLSFDFNDVTLTITFDFNKVNCKKDFSKLEIQQIIRVSFTRKYQFSFST